MSHFGSPCVPALLNIVHSCKGCMESPSKATMSFSASIQVQKLGFGGHLINDAEECAHVSNQEFSRSLRMVSEFAAMSCWPWQQEPSVLWCVRGHCDSGVWHIRYAVPVVARTVSESAAVPAIQETAWHMSVTPARTSPGRSRRSRPRKMNLRALRHGNHLLAHHAVLTHRALGKIRAHEGARGTLTLGSIGGCEVPSDLASKTRRTLG